MAITTTAPTISDTGITAPTYAEVLEYLKAKFRAIYGEDSYLEEDSKDGQLLAVFASAINDANSVSIAIYRSFSPSTAQGDALSSNVKINGIRRQDASYSISDLLIVGQVGTTIYNGIAKDANNYQWRLPDVVTIPSSGEISVSATCTTLGAIAAPAGTINKIGTPAFGWQTVTNIAAASIGYPVEKDATLRQRQKVSTSLPSLTVLDGIIGALANVDNVTSVVAYENDTSVTNGLGIPRNSIAVVIDGGDVSKVAQTICLKKTPGAGTYGSTSVTVNDRYNRPVTINFFRPTRPAISVAMTIKALTGYTTAIGEKIRQAVADYINAIAIGGGLSQGGSGYVEWAEAIASAYSVNGGVSYRITSLTLTGPNGAGAPDVPLLFTDMPTCSTANVTITVS